MPGENEEADSVKKVKTMKVSQAEYETFKNNKNFFYEAINSYDKSKFKFAHVDSIDVFEFIDELQVYPIQTFERFQEIDGYLKNQWAGMFYLYLTDLQNKKKASDILDVVSEIKNTNDMMKQMVNELGKNLLNNGDDYEKIIQHQNQTLLSFYAEQLAEKVDFDTRQDIDNEELKELSKFIYEVILESDLFYNYYSNNSINSATFREAFANKISEFNNTHKNTKLVIKAFNYYSINSNYHKKIKPIIDSDINMKNFFFSKLIEELKSSILPF